MSNEESKKPKTTEKMTSGARNLIILGAGATMITFLFTFVTLKIYHDSGDIYLDRSRPGFLPEKEEAEHDKDNTDYVFSDSGKITSEVLSEYLENLKTELNRLNDFSSEPFSATPLTDKNLGI